VGTLRIIAGEHRGRRIAVPAGVTVRPTADRVREALFSIVGPRLGGAVVLDAYAGSGALGFEALSRGAARAAFIEADAGVFRTLRANAAGLGLEGRSSMHHGPVADLLRRRVVVGPFDLILADPPYGAGEAGPFLAQAVSLLAEGGMIVIERDAGDEAPGGPRGLERSRTACYGRCRLDFYGRTA